MRLTPEQAAPRLCAALQARDPGLTVPAMMSALVGWDLYDFGGAVVARKGNEIHVGAPPDLRGKWFSRRAVRATIGQILDEVGVVKTTVMLDNIPGQRFVERLGFRCVGQDGSLMNYELTTTPFLR